jgi:hypothetical protein
MIKSNVRSHSTFRPIFAAIASLFAVGAVVQPAAAVVIPQTTQQMPSLAAFNGSLYLAWAGTDSSHHLNIASSTNGTTFGTPTVLSNTAASDTGPAIAVFNNLLYIGWQGGDGVLNVISSSDGVNFGSQQELSSYVSTCSPALAATSTVIYLAYCSGGVVEIISSVDGVNWSSPTNTQNDVTAASPALAISGSDLVLAYYNNFLGQTLIWSVPATSSLPGPNDGWANIVVAGGGGGGPGLASYNGLLYLGLSGSSSDVFTYQAGGQFVSNDDLGTSVDSATNPALAFLGSHLFYAWKGTDNPAHLNIVEVF